MDSGIDVNHSDFTIFGRHNLMERSDDVTDNFGHGTHIAGLIAGNKTGVAPNVELYVVKVLNNDGHGNMANVMDGITFAINYGIDVLSISLGTQSVLPIPFQERIMQAYNAGITIVCATGNDGLNTSNYPALMDEVIAVGGLDRDMNIASFSNGGYDVLAPSVSILSTYKDGQYARMTGTSMASPLVAGGVALMISHYRNQGKNLTPTDIKDMTKGLDGIFDLSKLID
jgi:subtilisin family serine protease